MALYLELEGKPFILGDYLRRVWEREVSHVVDDECKAMFFLLWKKKREVFVVGFAFLEHFRFTHS